MFNEKLLVDIGLAIQILEPASGGSPSGGSSTGPYTFRGDWFGNPLAKTNEGLSTQDHRDALVAALQELLERPLQSADGVARFKIPDTGDVDIALTLRSTATGIALGVSVGVDAPSPTAPVFSGRFELLILEYRPDNSTTAGLQPGLVVKDVLDVHLDLALHPSSQDPFKTLELDARYQTGIPDLTGNGTHSALEFTLTLEELKGAEASLLSTTFTLEPLDAPEGWEGELVQLGFFGLQALLTHLSGSGDAGADLQNVATLLLEHLMPLFGWLPPKDGSGLAELPPLDLVEIFQDPGTAFQGWLRETFADADTRADRLKAMLTHLAELVTAGNAAEATDLTGLASLTGVSYNGQRPIAGARLLSTPLPVGVPNPSLLLWVKEPNPSTLELCFGLRAEVVAPAIGQAPANQAAPYFYAEPALELNIEALALSLKGPMQVKALRKAELFGTLRPVPNTPHILGNLNGPTPNDPLIDHLQRLNLGLSLEDGRLLRPTIALEDLKVDNQTWNTLDLTNSAALMEVATAAAVDAVTDVLSNWLGDGLGDPIAILLGLRHPDGYAAWPVVVPASINNQTDPRSSQKLQLLVSNLPIAYASWLYELMDPAQYQQNGFQQWVEQLKTLLDAIHVQATPAIAGNGQEATPWRVSLMPDNDPLGLDLNLGLCFTTIPVPGSLHERQLKCDLRLDLLAEAIGGTMNGAFIKGGLKINLFDVTLSRTSLNDPATVVESHFVDEMRAFLSLDSDLQLNPPSLNVDPGRVVRAELGEAESALVWRRGAGLHTSLKLIGARIVNPSNPTQTLRNGPVYELRDLQPGGGLGDLSTHLLLATFALDQATPLLNEPTYQKAADFLLGIQQFMGYVPSALAPRAWPAFDPALGNLDSIEGLKDFFTARGPEGFLELLTQRLNKDTATATSAGVGIQETLEWFAALVTGQMAPWMQNQPVRFKSGLLGSWENPFSVVLVRGPQGLPQLELLGWSIPNRGGLPSVGLGLRGLALKKTKDDITVYGSARVDVCTFDVTLNLPAAQRLSFLPYNFRYDTSIYRENGSALWKDASKNSEVGSLAMGLAWHEVTGMVPVLELRDAQWQGQGPGGPGVQNIPIDDPLASPLLNAVQNMDKSPFKLSQKHPALALLMVLESIGIFTLGSGSSGTGGFLANPVQGFRQNPGQWLKDQFIDPNTGILRLHALVRALDGNGDSSVSLLQLLDLKRDAGEEGLDLALEPNGTLRLTAVKGKDANADQWLSVGWNPVTRKFDYNVHYDIGIGRANSHAGPGVPFALWIDLDQDLVEKLVGDDRIDIVPPDWNTLARILGIVVGALGTVVWLWLVFKYRGEPWMKKDTNRLKPVFIASGLLIPKGNDFRVPNLIELIKFGADWEKKLLGRPTMEALQDAIGAWTMFKEHFLLVLQASPRVTAPNTVGAKSLQVGMNATTSPPGLETSVKDGAFLRYGTLEPVITPTPPGSHPYYFGRMKLGQHGAFNFHVRAGGPWKPSNVLDTGKLQVAVVLGGLAKWTPGANAQQPGERRFGLETMIDQGGALRVDLLMKGPNSQTELRVPMYPVYDLRTLMQLLNPAQGTGRTLIAMLIERLTKTLHVMVSQPFARDLVAHLMMGLGVVKKQSGYTRYVEDLKWDPTAGDLELDTDKLKELTPVAATPVFPDRFHQQLDMFWMAEALFDLGQLYQLRVKGLDQNHQQYTRGTSPPNRAALQRYLRWDILEADQPNNKPVSLAFLAGNYPKGLDVPEAQDSTVPGVGLIFQLDKRNRTTNKPLLKVGDEKRPVVWGWLDTPHTPMRFMTYVELPVDLWFTLPKSGHDVHLATDFEMHLAGNDLDLELSLTAQTGRGQDYRGLKVDILPDFALNAATDDKSGSGQGIDATVMQNRASKGDAILALSATVVTELLLLEASKGDALLNVPIPFLKKAVGDVLGGIRDTANPRRRLFAYQNGNWVSLANPAHLSLANLTPDLMWGIENPQVPAVQNKSGRVSMPKVSMAVESSRYGITIASGAEVPLLPFADLLIGEEGATEAGFTLWVLEYSGSLNSVKFSPGLGMKDVGFRFHGKDERPLLDAGAVSLQSVSVKGAAQLGLVKNGAAVPNYGGFRIALEELAIPLGRAKSDGASARMLNGDGANPGFSVAVSFNYTGPGAGLGIEFFGGTVDAATGVHWFNVGRKTGVADIGRIGLLHTPGNAGLSDDVVKLLVDGSFKMGPLSVEVLGFGLTFPLATFYDVTTWKVELEGLGISYVSANVTVLGALVREPPAAPGLKPGYVGAAIVKVNAFEFSALGAWSEIDVGNGKTESSLFVFARFTAKPGIGGPPFFFVTGLAGGFGYNRAFNLPTMDKLPDFPLLKAMNAPTPAPGQEKASALAMISEIQAALPPKNDAYWLALGVTFTSFVVVRGSALLYLTLDDGFTIGIMGLAYFKQPASKPLVSIGLALNASFSTAGDDPRLLIQAQLTEDSWVLSEACRLSGGFALGIWFKRGDMVLTFGGYHPSFQKPEHYPDVPRIGLRFQPMPELLIKGENYFAITPREMMFGSLVSASYFKANDKHPKKGVFASFEMGFDVRIGWEPFFYDVHLFLHLYGELRNKNGEAWFSLRAGADVWVWGPKFGGAARAYVGPFSIDFSFGAPKALEKSWIPLDAHIVKNLLPEVDTPSDRAFVQLDAGRYMLKKSARASIRAGRRSAANDSSETRPEVLEVLPEFTVDVRLVAPATSVGLMKNGTDATPVSINRPGLAAVTSFDPVDLVPAGKNNWHLPVFVAVKDKNGAVIDLSTKPQVQVTASASGFPAAQFDMDSIEKSNSPSTTTLTDSVSLRFNKTRGQSMTFKERAEVGTLSPGIPLTVAPKTKSSTSDAAWQSMLKSADSGSVKKVGTASTTATPALVAKVAAPSTNRNALMTAATGTAGTATPAPTASIPGAPLSTWVPPATSFTQLPNGTLQQKVALAAGALAVVQVDGIKYVSADRPYLTLSGDQLVSVVTLDRTGDLLSVATNGPGGTGKLPSGTATVVLTGLGNPQSPTNVWKGRTPVMTLNTDGSFAVLGCNPYSLLLHAGKGTFITRCGVIRVLNQDAIRWPSSTLMLARTALGRGTRFSFKFFAQQTGGGVMLHLRMGQGQTALRSAQEVLSGIQILNVQRPGDPNGIANLEVVSYNGEQAVVFRSVATSPTWVECEVVLTGKERLQAVSFFQSNITAVATDLKAGKNWLAAQEYKVSSEGNTQATVEVRNG